MLSGDESIDVFDLGSAVDVPDVEFFPVFVFEFLGEDVVGEEVMFLLGEGAL